MLDSARAIRSRQGAHGAWSPGSRPRIYGAPKCPCAQPNPHGQCSLGGNDPPRPPLLLGGNLSPQTPSAPLAGGCRWAGPPGWDDQFMTERETPSVDGLVIGILG